MTLTALQELALTDIALRRLRLLEAAPGPATPKKKLTMLAELAGLGYRVENPEDFSDAALEGYTRTLDLLRAMRGGDVAYVPLFQGFPDKVPEENRYFVDRLIGHLAKTCGLSRDHGWLFELEQFGADPVSQMQREDLHEAGVYRQQDRRADEHVEWVSLRFASPPQINAALLEFLRSSLYARAALQETLQADLSFLLRHFSAAEVDASRVIFKETRTYLGKFYWDAGDLAALGPYCSTPTDILRLCAAVTGSDVALTKKIKFPRLNKAERRFILGCLERASNLGEDLNRYRGLWLALGRGLHPGEYAERFPQAAAAFAGLRKGRLETYNSRLETELAAGDLQACIPLLKQRPAVFGRRLHQVLERFPGRTGALLTAFEEVAPKIPIKNLLVLESYFQTIESSQYRAIFNKKGSIRVQPNRTRRLASETLAPLLETLQRSIRSAIAAKNTSWSDRKVWIDPQLRNYTVPLQLRKASEGLLVLGRGSRVPLFMDKVLRIFVYWKEAAQRTDLDLSLIKFNEALDYLGHVSYTQLADTGIVHSGDLQSAPLGAAEFIDIDLAVLQQEEDAHFIAPQIFRYCGDPFGFLQCHAGWMVRQRVDSNYASFDIKTVQNKLDLGGASSYAIPFLVDLKREEIVYVDLYVRSLDSHNRVEGAVQDISTITREMVRLLDTRPNLQRLAQHHLGARHGTSVDRPEDADIRFGLRDCDFGVDRMDRILAELMKDAILSLGKA